MPGQIGHDTPRRARAQACPQASDDWTATEAAYPGTAGLGHLAHGKRSGLRLHSTLAATGSDVPLGLIDRRTWTRDPADPGGRARRNPKETGGKESRRWHDSPAALDRGGGTG